MTDEVPRDASVTLSADEGSGRERRPTIKDVARQAGVSFKTVSRVVNRDPRVNATMREAVEQVMAALGYRPHRAARAMRSSRTFAVALLTGSRTDLGETEREHFPEYLGQVIAGCAQACRPAGYHLVLEMLAYGDRRKASSVAVGLLEDLAPDGVVLTPPLCDLDWLLDILEARSIPYVRLMPGHDIDRGACLVADDYGAAKQLTERLLAAGHRNLAFISGPPDHLAAAARRHGFEAALAACPGAWARYGKGDFYFASGAREATRLLHDDARPTALFAANDSMAAGALKAAADLGLSVPRQLAVAGFDDSFVATLSNPPLTSIRQPTAQLARRAAAMLIEAAARPQPLPSAITRLACTIVERESTAVASS
jgi:LacI family transcriptional regulator